MTRIARRVRAARHSNLPVSKNEQFVFARDRALAIYGINAVFSYIPKNACSAFRFSVAVANGFLDDLSQIDWIHANNRTFLADQAFLANCAYAFTVLRCPYTRLASCYLHRIVGGGIRIRGRLGFARDVSFAEYVRFVGGQPRQARHDHWRNQSDFLYFEEYDDYFCLENLDAAAARLAERGFQLHDTRGHIKHYNAMLERIEGDFCDTPLSRLRILRNEGRAPTYASMFDPETKSLVEEIFDDDLRLYRSLFGTENLLFD